MNNERMIEFFNKSLDDTLTESEKLEFEKLQANLIFKEMINSMAVSKLNINEKQILNFFKSDLFQNVINSPNLVGLLSNQAYQQQFSKVELGFLFSKPILDLLQNPNFNFLMQKQDFGAFLVSPSFMNLSKNSELGKLVRGS